jgi:RNA polymerase sigma-70 factor (ECF subfamily)
MVHDPEAAEDLTQETYGRALAQIESLRDPKAGLAWLYRIATNTALDRFRRKAPSTVPFDDVVVGEVEVAAARERPGISLIEEALERSEMSDCIQSYLQGLPDDYRVAILLHDVHRLTNPEVASVVGCSLPTAKIRVHRAHERLRATLQGVRVPLRRSRGPGLRAEAARAGKPDSPHLTEGSGLAGGASVSAGARRSPTRSR